MTQVTNEAVPAAADGSGADDSSSGVAAATCPFPHRMLAALPVAAGCPVRHDGSAIVRSRADVIARRVLFIKERPEGATAASAYSAFQKSMLISAFRCTLTYVFFPFVLPAVGFATGVGPVLGIVIGVFAITCDVFTIRRFFTVDHRWRWHFSAIAAAVICLLLTLLVQDIAHLVS